MYKPLITGVSKLTCLRRGVESTLQSNPNLAGHSKAINFHSQAVGKTHYDELSKARRSVFNNNYNKKEGSNQELDWSQSSDDEERAVRDKQETDEMKEKAAAYLKKVKEKHVKDMSPTQLSSIEIKFLSELFPTVKDKSDAVFKMEFYRSVDSLPSPKGRLLRDVESRMFQNYKREYLRSKSRKKEWGGSKKANQDADKSIR